MNSQETKRENSHGLNLLSQRQIKLIQLWQWQSNDGQIQENVERRCRYDHSVLVDALSWSLAIPNLPRARDWCALKNDGAGE